ncbi:MAG: hypothetical protein K0R54_4401 [Clostridiaceae bacterium]|jgi:hypothetical protein|nr:hypothetical protein [Clostridiaceae bacterium]
MNLWEKFDKAIDTEGLKKDVEAAAEGNMDFKEVPVGKYEVKITKMELTESKKGAPMLSIWFKILSGEYTGSLIFYNQVLSTGFGIHNANEMMRSFDTDIDVQFENFKQYNDVILDTYEAVDDKLEFALDYSKNAKGYNVYKITDVFEV